MRLYICSSDEEYSSVLNVHKLGVSMIRDLWSGHLAADAKFLDEIQVCLTIVFSDVTEQTAAFADHLQ